MYVQDNIAAIATPPGSGGVGIVRVSGPSAYEEAVKLLRSRAKHHNPGQLYFGRFVGCEGDLIDSGYFVRFQAPISFTGEDIVEFHCHGGMMILTSLLRQLFELAIRPARPGEFTQRAFMNGKLDLVQAEAIMDMISADSKKALAIAFSHHFGKLSTKITGLRTRVTEVLARLEVAMDYPDIDMDHADWRQTLAVLSSVYQELETLAASYKQGRLYREGVRTAILGKPNVGKSSLLNFLAGEERAIVTDIPGTTRDVLEIPVTVHGIPLRLMDTAGIRETSDVVEKIGVARARDAAARADLLILVFDRSQPADYDDHQLLSLIGGNTLAVLNKADLPSRVELDIAEDKIIELSALTGAGVEALRERIYHLFVRSEFPDHALLTNERHYQCICQARHALSSCIDGWQVNSLDILALDLRECWEALGEITGNVWTDDLLDCIFGQFCLGK